ncbi:GNAT family N-acetyltransferase [Ruminococcus albus]|uniref:Predicted N-acetyltransferase YhbS n=1 Tax=Ruminococcus albus TaxID=1264 RepID=A0A1I1EEX7_RUMAL|nr:GNAT family N-acetyltransferase [Ruminococcus albus]SFB85685.1 Predicted N-acetyltransferase YhbS [Ruminococcus albus]
MADFFIREVRPEDAEDIAEISREDLGYPCDAEMVRANISGLDSSREAVFVAEMNGRAVGYIHVEEYKVLYCEKMVNYLGLAVSGKCRRLGIGAALIKAAEEWAKERGITLVRLNSGSTRIGAHEFYKRQGYNGDKMQVHFTKRL